jgi:peptide deformylase
VRVGPSDILQLGHPSLRRRAEPVGDVTDEGFRREARLLTETLEAFRARFGFGRAIAAPQIGVAKRFVAADLGDGPFLLVDPRITWRSEETFTMWDDCMCFPDLLVRVRRHASVSLSYLDEKGESRVWDRLGLPVAELMQHELDHLDGVLAVDRAERVADIVGREAFEALREEFQSQVDHRPD